MILAFVAAPHASFLRVPAAESAAEIVMETDSRRVLYGDGIGTVLPMASTTKILTAILVIEECDLSQTVKIPREAAGKEGSSVYLKEGDEYSIEDLLYGLMLRSGNDCSVALALAHSGSEEKFVARMNEKADEIGALESHFANPNGLPADDHYTTAYDLALITCYALQNETFSKIVATTYYPKYGWQNKNKMLYSYEGADGVKTGYTIKAGRCLVTSATRQNMRLVCVVLNCPAMYERTAALLDDAFSHFRRVCLFDADAVFSAVTDVKGKTAEGKGAKSFFYPLREGEEEGISIEINLPARVALPVKKGDILGEIKIYFANQLIFSENLCSIKDVEKSYSDILKEIAGSFTP